MDPEKEIFLPPNDDSLEKGSITSDFNYNNNVASSHVYIRMGFLRKVYGLLTVQLLLTTLVAGVCAYTPHVNEAILNNPWILLLSLPLTLGLLVALHVKRHHVPINFFLLGAFTVLESISVGAVVSLYKTESVVMALLLTLIITTGLTLYTLQSKRDFSKMGAGLVIALIILIGLGLMNLFFASKGMDLLLAGIGALIFSLFIVFDTHMMMEKLSPEEYILATINLYLDIINLFIELLRIFGQRQG